MSCKDTITVRRDNGREEEVPIEDLFEPFIPPDDPDPEPPIPGGDPNDVQSITVGTIFNRAAADGVQFVRIIAQIFDGKSLGVAGVTVSVAHDDGLTSLPASATTNDFGEAVFEPTSETIGSFRPTFKHVDTTAKGVTVEFEDPDTFIPGDGSFQPNPDDPSQHDPDVNPKFGEDLKPQEAIDKARVIVGEIRALLNAIEPFNHPILTPGRVQNVRDRVDAFERWLDIFDNQDDGVIRASFDEQKAINAAVSIGRGRTRWLNDATYDPTDLDAKIEELINVMVTAFGSDRNGDLGSGQASDDLDKALGETNDPGIWQEKSRKTSTVTIDGVEIERIDEVTFTVPGGREVTLKLDHPEA